jgi:hypothetical protein
MLCHSSLLPYHFSLACCYCCRAATEDAEFQARLELIKAEAAQKKAAGVSHTKMQAADSSTKGARSQ